MEKVKCKECGKEINKKAEICPNCGCRVKSNTLKIVIICLIISVLLLGGYIGAKYIKHQIDENKRLETEKIEKDRIGKLKKSETKILESYFNNYSASSETLNQFVFRNYIPLKKCEVSQEGEIGNYEDFVCVSFENAETIDRFVGLYTFDLYKLEDNKTILATYLENLVDRSKIDFMNIDDETVKLLYEKVCFKFDDENNLMQTSCPSIVSGEMNGVKEKLDLKYEIKLTKIK